jgi:hypothetical protein
MMFKRQPRFREYFRHEVVECSLYPCSFASYIIYISIHHDEEQFTGTYFRSMLIFHSYPIFHKKSIVPVR